MGRDTMELLDSQLLQAWEASRDAQAFAEIVRRHAGMVYSVARRVTGNSHDAEDVAQAFFLELTGKSGTIRTSVGGWLHRAARFRAADAIREIEARRKHESRVVPRTNKTE